MIEQEHNIHKEKSRDFDSRILTRIEQMAIGSTPEGSSYETAVEDAMKNPELYLTPSSLVTSEKNIRQIEIEREENAELHASSFFNAEIAIDFYRKGHAPTMVLSSLDENGRVTELRIGRKCLYTKEYIPFTEADGEIYGLEIREELIPILSLSEVTKDGLLLFKQNILEEDEEDAA